jgi:hypothetical protein
LGYQRNSDDLAYFVAPLAEIRYGYILHESRCSHNYTRKRSLSYIALRPTLGYFSKKKKIFRFKRRKVKRHGIKAQPKMRDRTRGHIRGLVNLTRGEQQHRRDSRDCQDLVSARGEGILDEQAVRARGSKFREYESMVV